MRIIELDARGWENVLDFNAALMAALGSPREHGNSPDAWVDSMIYGGINEIEAPYVVRIAGTAACSAELKQEIVLLVDVIKDARLWRLQHYGDDVEVSFQIEP